MVGGTKFDSQSDDHGPSTGTDLIFIFMLIVSLSFCNLADVYEYYDADNHRIQAKNTAVTQCQVGGSTTVVPS